MLDTNRYSESHLSVSEVARIFGVTVPTVRNWDKTGKLPASFRTPSNQRRWNAADVQALRERAS